MPQCSQLEYVRETIHALFQTSGFQTSASETSGQTFPAEDLTETILIRNGCYCGRRFEHGGLSAVWFIEEGEIKVFGQEGQLQESLQVPGAPLLIPKAA